MIAQLIFLYLSSSSSASPTATTLPTNNNSSVSAKNVEAVMKRIKKSAERGGIASTDKRKVRSLSLSLPPSALSPLPAQPVLDSISAMSLSPASKPGRSPRLARSSSLLLDRSKRLSTSDIPLPSPPSENSMALANLRSRSKSTSNMLDENVSPPLPTIPSFSSSPVARVATFNENDDAGDDEDDEIPLFQVKIRRSAALTSAS